MKLIILVSALVLSACSVVLDPPACFPPPCAGTLVCSDESGCDCVCLSDAALR